MAGPQRLFAFGVLATTLSVASWSVAARAAHAAFGVCMIFAAAFSSRPADPGAPFVAVEDTLHSAAASVMGVAFALGVVLVAVRRGRNAWPAITLDVVAVVASVAIPLAIFTWDERAGVAQRVMFAIALTWYVTATAIQGRPAGAVDAATGAQPAATPLLPTGRSRPPTPPGPDARRRGRAAS